VDEKLFRVVLSPQGNGLRSTAFLRVTDFRWEQRLLAQSRLRLDLTQPLILRAISLPDVPFTLSLDNWLGSNPINQRRVITLLGAHDLGINVGRVDFKAGMTRADLECITASMGDKLGASSWRVRTVSTYSGIKGPQ